MLIQIDVDSTLYPAHELFSEVAREHYGVELPLDASNWHDYHDFTNTNTLHKIFRKAHSREYVMQQTPYPDAADTLQWVHEKGHQVFFVSDRHGQTFPGLIDWLKKHGFPIEVSHGNVSVFSDKRTWMKEHNPHIVIDDRVRTMVYARELQAIAIGIECPWNRNLAGEIEGIHIMKDWNEISSYLDKIL